MSSQNNLQDAKDQAVAVGVLQAQQASLDTALRDLQRTMTEGFAGVNLKMDGINELSHSIASVIARQESQQEAIARSFDSHAEHDRKLAALAAENAAAHAQIKTHVEEKLSQLESRRDSDWGKLTEKFSTIDRKLNFSQGAVWAIGALGGLLLGVLWWSFNPWIQRIQDIDRTIIDIKMEQARNHPIPLPPPVPPAPPTILMPPVQEKSQ